MVISPRSHPFGISVIWHNVGVVSELFVTDCTYPVLFGNFWWETLHAIASRRRNTLCRESVPAITLCQLAGRHDPRHDPDHSFGAFIHGHEPSMFALCSL